MRTTLTHYIAPSAISITPNANNSQRDLAVYVARGAKIKVYSPNAGINTDDSIYQEWTLEGRNRRLNDPDGTIPFTIFARLNRNGEKKGYLVFAQKNLLGWDENLQKVWADKYSSVTADGQSVLYTENGVEKRNVSTDYWYIRLGEVSLPDTNGKRTVTLDTGILGTDQFNREWVLNPDALPLRVELDCTINGKDAGPTPNVAWGESARLAASLVEAWNTDANDRVHHWTITRNTGDDEMDEPWNYPYVEEEEDTEGSEEVEEEEPENETPPRRTVHLMPGGQVVLAHLRAGTDDFNASPSVVFTVTAWGEPDTTQDVPEKGDLYPPFETLEQLVAYIQSLPETSDSSDNDDDEPQYVQLADTSITIFANATKLRVQLDCSIDGQNVGQTPYVLWGKELLMAASLVEGLDVDASQLVDHWTITRYTGDDEADVAWNYPQEEEQGSSSEETQTEEDTPEEEDGSSSEEEEQEAPDPAAAHPLENGNITLAHQRTGTDDFAGAVAAVFTVTAWAVAETPEEPGGDSSDSSEDSSSDSSEDDDQQETPADDTPAEDEEETPQEPVYAQLATGIITIFPETIEKYTLALSSTVMGYNPQTKAYTPGDGVQVRIRVTEQNGDISYITRGFLEHAGFTAGYAPVGTDIELLTAEPVEEDTSISERDEPENDNENQEEIPDGGDSQEEEQPADTWVQLTFSGSADDVAIATIPAAAFEVQQPLNVRLVNGARMVIDLRSIAYVRDGEDSKEREWIYKLSNSETPPSIQNLTPAVSSKGDVSYFVESISQSIDGITDGDEVIVQGEATLYAWSNGTLTDLEVSVQDGDYYELPSGDKVIYYNSQWTLVDMDVVDSDLLHAIDGFVPQGWSDHAQMVSADTRFLYACWRDFNRDTGLWGDFRGPIIWSAWGEKGIDGDGVQYVYKLFDHELTDDTEENGVTIPGGRTTEIPDVPLNADGEPDFNEDGELIPRGSGKNAGWYDDPLSPTRDMPYCYCSVIKEINGTWGTFGKLGLWSRWSENSIRFDLDNQADLVSLDSDGKVRFQRVVTTKARIYDGSSVATEGVQLNAVASSVKEQLTFATGVVPTLYDGTAAAANELTGNDRSVSSGILVVQWTFPAGTAVTTGQKDIILEYRDIPYSGVFSLASTNADAVWQVMPNPSEVSFALGSDNLLTPATQYLKCGYTKQTGSGTESVAEASTTGGQIRHNNADSGMYIYYRYYDTNTSPAAWSSWNTYPDGGNGIPVARGTAAKDYELCITNGPMANDESNIEDREAVPVVKAAFNGKDAKDSEWAYIRTKTNIAPVIDSDSSYTDSNGKSYTADGHLPKVVAGSGGSPNDIESDNSGNNNKPYECTATPKDISETWKYEWEIKRTKGDAVNDGRREWLPYSGQMALRKNFADEAYTVQANPASVTFRCDAAGQSVENTVKEVALSMYKGKDPAGFTASVITGAVLRCFAWVSGATLYISTGTAWKYGSATYYTAKPSPAVGDTVYDNSANNIGTVSSASGGTISISGLSGSYVRQANVSLYSLAQDGGVGITLTATTGSVSRSLTIPVVGSRQGLPGTAGPMLYPAGKWVDYYTDGNNTFEKIYNAYGDSRPYVYYESDGNYYYLSDDSAGASDVPGESDKWTLMTQVDVVFAKFGIMDYGKMASAVFCGDWMYSQYGKLYPTDNIYGSYYFDEYDSKKSVNTPEPEYYIVDSLKQGRYDESDNYVGNNGHWKYDDPYICYDNNSAMISAAPFAYFNPAYPQGGQPATFAPNWCVNLKTGEQWGAGGNMHISANGDTYIRGEVHATSGDFENVKISGGMRSPFTYIAPNGTFNNDFSDNVAIYSTDASQDANNEVLPTEYNIPWDSSQSGRRIIVANYKWENGLQIATGYVKLSAPSGKYFFEDGIQKSSIYLSREIVELIGYGDSQNFYGWVVLTRTDLGTNRCYGHNIKVLAMGVVTVTGTTNADITAMGQTFDKSSLSLVRNDTGKYTITFGNTDWFENDEDVFVMVTGCGSCADNSNKPIYANLNSKNKYGFTVWTGDDDTLNDGSFNFIVMNYSDWSSIVKNN